MTKTWTVNLDTDQDFDLIQTFHMHEQPQLGFLNSTNRRYKQEMGMCHGCQ